MIRIYLGNILRFITLVLLQVLVFDNIRLGGYVTPFIYVLFIILLPFTVPKWLLLISAFFLGFVTDIFYNTLGMHAAACVFIAFLRPVILNIFAPRDGYETGTFPRIYYYGPEWFLKYSVSLIFLHHIVLFSIEVFSITEFHHILLRTFLSTLLTGLIVVISQYFIYRR